MVDQPPPGPAQVPGQPPPQGQDAGAGPNPEYEFGYGENLFSLRTADGTPLRLARWLLQRLPAAARAQLPRIVSAAQASQGCASCGGQQGSRFVARLDEGVYHLHTVDRGSGPEIVRIHLTR
jgi:hypothetical protein